jgi:site-specific DNA-methyltransferase (adenine-specific)
MYKIIQGKCENEIPKLKETFQGVITSPPYNTSRTNNTDRRYVEYDDNLTVDEYIEWTVDYFNKIEQKLDKNGVVLFNINYGTEFVDASITMWLVIAEIIKRTPFVVADHITWKKSTAAPINGTANKLTRICESIFVFVRETEFATFKINKEVSSISRTGQKYYKCKYNFIEAKNNDGYSKNHKATYSVELVSKLIDMYFKEGDTILDPFNGTGTTGEACLLKGLNYIGIELSKEYCELSEKRLKSVKKLLDNQITEW